MIGQTVSEEGNGIYGGLYISWDRFVNGVFQDDVIWVLPKDKIYAGAGFSFSHILQSGFKRGNGGRVQPADVMDRGYRPRTVPGRHQDFDFNCNAGSSCNGLVVWAIYYGVPPAGGSPTLTGSFVVHGQQLHLSCYSDPASNPSGTECAVNTGPAGITSEVYWSAGDLYLTASTAALNKAARDSFLYWRVHPYLTNARPAAMNGSSIRNEVCWGCNGFTDNTISEYYPAVQPTEEGDITIVFNWSSSSQYPSTAFLSSRTRKRLVCFPIVV